MQQSIHQKVKSRYVQITLYSTKNVKPTQSTDRHIANDVD